MLPEERVLVLSGCPTAGLAVARCLGRAGCRVEAWTPRVLSELRLSRCVARVRRRPLALLSGRTGDLARALDEELAARGLHGVVPADELTTRALAGVQDRLRGGRWRFPLPTPAQLDALDDPAALRARLEGAGLSVGRGPEVEALALLAHGGRLAAWARYRPLPGGASFDDGPGGEELAGRLAAALELEGPCRVSLAADGALAVRPGFPPELEAVRWAGLNLPVLALRLAVGEQLEPRAISFSGPCQDPGLSLRRLAGQLARGRFVPDALEPASKAAWVTNFADPLPALWRRLARRGRHP